MRAEILQRRGTMRVHSRFTTCWPALAGFILLGGCLAGGRHVGRFSALRGSGHGCRARPQCALAAQLPEGGVEHRRLPQRRKTLGHPCPGSGERSGRLCPGLRSPLRPAHRPLSQRRAAHGAALVKERPTGRRPASRWTAWPVTAARSGGRATWGWETPRWITTCCSPISSGRTAGGGRWSPSRSARPGARPTPA